MKTADIILIPLLTKSLLYLKKDQDLCLKKVAELKISNCWEKTSTFAPFLILFLWNQILPHAGDEIKTTGMFAVPSSAQ